MSNKSIDSYIDPNYGVAFEIKTKKDMHFITISDVCDRKIYIDIPVNFLAEYIKRDSKIQA